MFNPPRPLRLRIRVLLPALVALWPLAAAAQDAAEHELDEAQLERGREIFLEEANPPCNICHRLADAEAQGRIAPNLDQLQPTKERVLQALRSGPGAMPDYSATLTDDQMKAVAEYVAAVAGQP
jgi:cytochrome c6